MDKRGSGILLHITSLPSSYGIGDLGPQAYKFADFLALAKQSYWQVLPLNPTTLACRNSPYSSISAFAGNALLISPDFLIKEGFLRPEDVLSRLPFPGEKCDYARVIPYKEKLLNCAFKNFIKLKHDKNKFEEFCARNSEWLEDFAFFAAIKRRFKGKAWSYWPEALRDRDPRRLGIVKRKLKDSIAREKFLQYLFFKQWFALKNYCNQKGIQLIGDVSMYVSYDSSDVWVNPQNFKLDENKRPTFVAGVPPDYYSNSGQRWGNPVYDWEALKESGFNWWLKRMEHSLRLFNVVRIDHFRGFVAYWQIPAGEKTAINGCWVSAPAVDFFNTLLKNFPRAQIIAEDLGLITPEVKEIIRQFGFPGMRILLFAFGEDNPQHPYLPHKYIPNCVVYTGTHDNNTIRGWFENEAGPEVKKRLFDYLGREVSGSQIPAELIRLAMESSANTAIIPLQDVLGLGKDARMNKPATIEGNWQWRFLSNQLTPTLQGKLSTLAIASARA